MAKYEFKPIHLLYGGIGLLALVFSIKYGIAAIKKSSSKKGLKEAEKEKKDLEQNMNPTFLDSQYHKFADALQRAMHDIGTDEAAIYDVFRKIKNDLDFLKIETAFGIREYTGDILPSFVLGSPKYNLSEWINEELSASEKNKLNGILKERNIKYMF